MHGHLQHHRSSSRQFKLISLVTVVLLLSAFTALKGHAASEMKHMIGFRTGFLALDRDEFFFEYEVFVSKRLFSPGNTVFGRSLNINLDGSYGSLNAAGKNSISFVLGPTFQFGLVNDLISLNIGTSAAFITEQQFGNENLGGHLQFVSHAGFGYMLTSEVGLTYRFQHMSNAGLGNPNPGVDLHAIGVGYSF